MALLRVRKPDGEIVEIASLPGAKGDKGNDGEPGYTPVKGLDYYTEAEKAELIAIIKNEVTGDIDTALDSIIAIQEHLINGKPLPISFNLYTADDLTGTNYTAEEGMTWIDWCNSAYNTIGARISGPGDVAVDVGELYPNGGRLWLDAGTKAELGTNVIVVDGRYLVA